VQYIIAMQLTLDKLLLAEVISKGVNDAAFVDIEFTDANNQPQGAYNIDGTIRGFIDNDGTNVYVGFFVALLDNSLTGAFNTATFPIDITAIWITPLNQDLADGYFRLDFNAGELTATNLTDLKQKVGAIKFRLQLAYSNPLPVV